jgi:hypothetical protein
MVGLQGWNISGIGVTGKSRNGGMKFNSAHRHNIPFRLLE